MGLGFTVEPDSPGAYGSLLQNADELFYRRMICDCAYIPDTPYQFWLPFNEIEFWQTYRQALDDITPEDDPLFYAFSDFVALNNSTLLRPR